LGRGNFLLNFFGFIKKNPLKPNKNKKTYRGVYWEDGAGNTKLIHPLLSQLCVDYMESIFYTQTRGVNANYPCTSCLVPKDRQSELQLAIENPWPLRTPRTMKKILVEADKCKTIKKRNDLLQRTGLSENGELTYVKLNIFIFICNLFLVSLSIEIF
jgi:hypothetical protein